MLEKVRQTQPDRIKNLGQRPVTEPATAKTVCAALNIITVVAVITDETTKFPAEFIGINHKIINTDNEAVNINDELIGINNELIKTENGEEKTSR